VHSAVEDFAQQLANVIRRFLKSKGWRETECVAVGGGFRNSRVGEIAIGRAAMLLKAEELNVGLEPIHHHPDGAGLIGAFYLMPSWMIEAHDGIIAVDIGGTNIRPGVVASNLKKAADLAKAEVWKSELWRHANGDPKRDEAVERLVEHGRGSDRARRQGQDPDRTRDRDRLSGGHQGGRLDRGRGTEFAGQLGKDRFNLAEAIRAAIPAIGDHETAVIIHNDAVVQGLSELPFMRDFDRWGILTIGTGLGNARFTNRSKASQKQGD
jgi:hypothetical protein